VGVKTQRNKIFKIVVYWGYNTVDMGKQATTFRRSAPTPSSGWLKKSEESSKKVIKWGGGEDRISGWDSRPMRVVLNVRWAGL